MTVFCFNMSLSQRPAFPRIGVWFFPGIPFGCNELFYFCVFAFV